MVIYGENGKTRLDHQHAVMPPDIQTYIGWFIVYPSISPLSSHNNNYNILEDSNESTHKRANK